MCDVPPFLRSAALALLAALTLTGCEPAGDHSTVLVAAAAIDAVSLDPAVAYEFTSANLCLDFYDTLVRYEGADFTHPIPSLAESWEVSKDGTEWTFRLRPHLKFASGRPLNAESVRWSMVRVLKLKQGPSDILGQNLDPEGITAPDELIVKMKLKRPCAFFLTTLFNSVAGIVDRGEVEAHDMDWMRDHSAGSGPYVLHHWERDVGVELRVNENYWGKKPALRRIVVKDIKEPTMQAMMLERGDVDIAFDVMPSQAEKLGKLPQVSLLPAPLLRVWYLGMNVEQKPLDDVRVRQAVRMAIDYDGIVKYLAKGNGKHIEGPVVEGLLGYQPELGVYRHDPTRARELLAEAGFPGGLNLTLTSSSGSTTFGASIEDLTAKLQQDLKEVGINASVSNLASTAYIDLYRKGALQLNIGDWGADYPDADNFVQPFGHSTGSLAKRVRYKDPKMDALVDGAARELDPKKRAQMYVDAQKMLAETGPWAILFEPSRVLPVRSNVKGFVWSPLSSMDFSKTYKEASK